MQGKTITENLLQQVPLVRVKWPSDIQNILDREPPPLEDALPELWDIEPRFCEHFKGMLRNKFTLNQARDFLTEWTLIETTTGQEHRPIKKYSKYSLVPK